jgi:hypothetical protein
MSKLRCPNSDEHNEFRKTVNETHDTWYNRQGKRLRRRRASLEVVAFVCTVCGAKAVEEKVDNRP